MLTQTKSLGMLSAHWFHNLFSVARSIMISTRKFCNLWLINSSALNRLTQNSIYSRLQSAVTKKFYKCQINARVTKTFKSGSEKFRSRRHLPGADFPTTLKRLWDNAKRPSWLQTLNWSKEQATISKWEKVNKVVPTGSVFCLNELKKWLKSCRVSSIY